VEDILAEVARLKPAGVLKFSMKTPKEGPTNLVGIFAPSGHYPNGVLVDCAKKNI